MTRVCPRWRALYQGLRPADQVVRTASLEPRLELAGKGVPILRVHLRRWEGREQNFKQLLKLTVPDARELVTALNYLIETADKG